MDTGIIICLTLISSFCLAGAAFVALTLADTKPTPINQPLGDWYE